MNIEIDFGLIYKTLTEFNDISVAFRIVIATIIGGCIGFDRGRHGRAAGLRTHILVCLGATMTTMIGIYCTEVLGYSNDPLRMGAQVISGIGFLGAGTILLRSKTHITGLTTAAGLWTTATLGLAIGIGFYWGVFVAFLVMVLTISILSKLDKDRKNAGAETYYLEVNQIEEINSLNAMIEANHVFLHIVPSKSKIPTHVGVELTTSPTTKKRSELIAEIRALDYVVLMVPVQL